jgi:hypothetical protein
MKRLLLFLPCLFGLCVLSACGGGGGVSTNNSSGGGTPQPTVTISASPSAVTVGQAATLTWSSTNATSCAASASPSESDWSGSEPMTGSQSVRPGSAGMITYTLSCSGAGGSASQSASVTGNAPALRITSGTPPSGIAGVLYGERHVVHGPQGTLIGTFFQLNASTGVVWSWAAAPGSSLPPGLTCCTVTLTGYPRIIYRLGGAIFGVPTATGTYHIVVTASVTSPAAQVSATYTIVINNPFINTTPAPAIGTLNQPHVGFTFTATGGILPLTWSETGALPPGLVFGTDGVLSGTPTAVGAFPVTVTMQDSAGNPVAPQDFTLQVFSKGFTSTGSMGTARQSHTATLLGTGKVLVAGGSDLTGTLATAELYDPTAGTFSPTGSMETGRNGHTATLLKDGKVLVAGGPDATAELYDPTAGKFSPTGSMGAARYNHTATLLNDGKVLVTGGWSLNPGNVSPALTTAELYDPGSGTFSPTGSMGSTRTYHAATLLTDGKVLVTGGGSPTAELYDPNSGSFSATGGMETGRNSHTATLLNTGKVLVAGGGGNTAELYDPTSGTFSPTGSMEIARLYQTATLLNDGRVLVTGGDDVQTQTGFTITLSSAELFDPVSGTFTAAADMTAARAFHTATLLPNGGVLVVGGLALVGATVWATAELF